jgi:hypothetical protein
MTEAELREIKGRRDFACGPAREDTRGQLQAINTLILEDVPLLIEEIERLQLQRKQFAQSLMLAKDQMKGSVENACQILYTKVLEQE